MNPVQSESTFQTQVQSAYASPTDSTAKYRKTKEMWTGKESVLQLVTERSKGLVHIPRDLVLD